MTPEDLALLESKLSDPMWRLTSGEIYKIKTADGRGVIPFPPRAEQVELLQELVTAVEAVKNKAPGWEKHQRKMKLKARRLGWSTTIGVFVADCLCFRKSFTATLIDQTGDDAKKKMNGIVKVAVNSAMELFPMRKIKDNDSELTIDSLDPEHSAPSTFYAGTKSRGGSNDFLWPSEIAVIQFDDPKRADEIVSGAFPSARHGVICGETTWKGGKGGKVYDLIKPTLEGKADDWSVDFSPWWQDPRNVAPEAAHDVESQAYFASIEERLDKEGITLSDAQRRWWAMERRTQGIFMMRENPTFLDECWKAPVEGAIYAAALDRARTEGRVVQHLPRADVLVHTSWDLGAPQNAPCWMWQVVGREIHIIDYDIGSLGETITARIARLLRTGYNFGTHFLPHDAEQTERTGRTFAGEVQRAGLGRVRIVPRTKDVWIGINYLLGLFPSLVFLEPRVKTGLEALQVHHTKEVTASGIVSNEPVHDWSMHPCDGLRTMAEAVDAGMVKVADAIKPKDPDEERRRRNQPKRARMSVGG